MRVLLSGGGTAGHINPAIAIADLIKKHDPHAEIAFVGTPDGMENRLVTAAGYPMHHIRVRGFSRSFSPRNAEALLLAVTSPIKARGLISDFAPNLVIGTGGYVCWPTLRAAAALGIPCALHESNAVPGLTVRRLAPYMDGIWLNFKEAASYLPSGCVEPVITGNPLRTGFLQMTREEAKSKLGFAKEDVLLLSFGGSLGAERLNEAMLRIMKHAEKRSSPLKIVHACGTKHYSACRAKFGADTAKSKLLPYIDNMPQYMAAADIVICRAGAMTVSELALCGKCAVLIPSPHVAGDHQRKNALLFQKRHAACMIEEDELPQNKFGKIAFSLRSDRHKRAEMEKNIQKMAIRDANEVILGEIEQLAKKRGQI